MLLRYALTSTLFATVVIFLPPLVSAQPQTPQMPAPPPMRFVSREDRAQLTAAKDPKDRVRLTIELADTRLTRLEELTAQKEFEQASAGLGNYLALVEDAKRFIAGLTQDKNSTRDLYRKLDIALRAQIPRLVVMRRATPADYGIHLKAAEEFVRDTRSEVLEAFYGHTVLREPRPPENSADATKNPPEENKRP